MRYFEVDGSTPKEILSQFLSQQDIPAEFVEMEVIEQGSRGLLGIGRKPAKVMIKFNDYEFMKRKARLYLSEVLTAAGFSDYYIDVTDQNPECIMNIKSSNAAALTGRSAIVLDSLQYLVDRVTHTDNQSDVQILVDVDDYRKRVIAPLREKAIKLAHSVKKTGRPAKMQPMATIVRREIHIAAKSVSGVTTVSNGSGQVKTLTILPERKGKQGGRQNEGRQNESRQGGEEKQERQDKQDKRQHEGKPRRRRSNKPKEERKDDD
ncbi:MAG: Jag N-terminal domain-containing protein [Deferribacteraceae bacterium]|jgi:spoIIIJ-associated protein|nr:Jag N-terminal domain-containing protein [Deferribacteraceae bacterium]